MSSSALCACLFAFACAGGGPTHGAEGAEGGHCYPNRTCNAGLTCASNLCVLVGGGDGGTACPDCEGGVRPPDPIEPGAGSGASGSSSAGQSGSDAAGSGGLGGSGASGASGAGAGGTGGTAGADVCLAGACLPVECGGDTCASPPPSVCSGPNTLDTFPFRGVCVGTSCNYPATQVACTWGCVAGQCQSESQTLHPWAGLYRGTYSGTESGTLLVVVDPNGAVTAHVTSTRGTEVYSGTIDANGELAVSGMLIGAIPITFSGSMSGVGPNRMGAGTWSAPGAAASGTWQTDEVNPWAGHYTGSFAGALSGTLDVTTADDGTVTVLASGMTFVGAVRIDGTLDVTGALGGGVTVSYEGAMSGLAPNRSGSGTWTSSIGGSGTWSIRED